VEEDKRQKMVEECIDRVLELEGDLELVEASISGSGRSAKLRVYIYKTAGVTVEDCARISRGLRRELEHEPELADSFSIEVSSPGLDRKLRTRRDFERAVGEVLFLSVEDEEGARSIGGRLTEVEEEALLLDPIPGGGGRGGENAVGDPFRIPLSSVREGSIEILMQ